MSTYHVAFTARVPHWILEHAEAGNTDRARSWILLQGWYERRRLEWNATLTVEPDKAHSPIRHEVILDLDCPETDRPSAASFAFTVKVGVRHGEDPIHKARRVLDLSRRRDSLCRKADRWDVLDRGSFRAVRGSSLIGPMPPQWPIDRTLTAFSSHLGSYGQGGVGLAGWQCNGGSWMVLPLTYSDGWIWLTREEIRPAPDHRSLAIAVDQRILGVHPDQLADFPPWEHRYAGQHQILDMPDFGAERPTILRFDASETGFILEAANGPTRWRFAMGDDLPRPVWGGSRKPRLLCEGESFAEAFCLAHDCYLEV